MSLFQLKEDSSVHGSDEEADVSPEVDSDDEDLSDGEKNLQEEVRRYWDYYLVDLLRG